MTALPNRMALAGGWIDQPFVSRCNPEPPGSMVVVSLDPALQFMDRSGMASGTRKVALELWGNCLPAGDRMTRVRELYQAENHGKPDPSGSQDMIGLIYPGVSRLDYDFRHEGGYFPVHIESNCDPAVAAWLESVIHFIPVAPRPAGYSPLIHKNLDPEWIRRLGQSGKDCYEGIVTRNIALLGRAMNECMQCWEAILPATVEHPTISIDLKAILAGYQASYPGAMYSGCGGGYLIVASEAEVPESFPVKVAL